MANILFTIDNDSRQVSKERAFAGVQLENLEDTFVIKFSKTFLDGDGSLEYEVNGQPCFLPLTKNAASELYYIAVQNVIIPEEGTYPFQIRITRGEKVFKSQIFYLKIYPAINAVDAPPPLPNWQEWVIDYVDEHGGAISSISVNGVEQPIDENKNVNILVPTKTSDLINDGDGDGSNYATEEYVNINGGKIDVIALNGTDLEIVNKRVNIVTDFASSQEINDMFIVIEDETLQVSNNETIEDNTLVLSNQQTIENNTILFN